MLKHSLRSLVVLACLWQDAVATCGPTVTIKDGQVIGTRTYHQSATTAVDKYLGIPFASSPPKRFSPPEDPEPWSKPLQAKEYKPACIQQFPNPKLFRNRLMALYNTPPLEESEDCLYLNVFAPSTEPPRGGRAVMVWIYGGTLQIGGAQFPPYHGASLASNQDVVVVVPNYRMGPFGFSGSPEITTGKQNSGFLDQRKALQWVQENIAAFGGDPTKVTIFGESAGAHSVQQLIIAPPDPLPYRAAIMQSLPIFGPSLPSSWKTLVKRANCSDAKSPTACMRKVPAKVIDAISERDALTFNPVIDNVTSASFQARERLSNGVAAPVPFIVGSNSQEGRLFAYVFGWDKPKTKIRTILNSMYPGQKSLQKAIMKAYSDDLDNPYRFLARYQTDLIFTCPISALTSSLPAGTNDIYRYYYNTTFPNVDIFPDSGVYHGAEIEIVFGTYPRKNATAQEVALSKDLQKMWADFAKHPHRGPGWPKLGSNRGKELFSIGSEGSIKQRLTRQEKVDGVCKIYKDVLTPL